MTSNVELREMQEQTIAFVGDLAERVGKTEERVSDMSVDMFDMKTSQKAMIKLLWSIQEKQLEHDRRFDGLESRMDIVEGRLDALEDRMDKLEDRMDKLEGRMAKLESRMDNMEDLLKAMSQQLTRISDKLDKRGTS